jgi:hypothetical protein
MKSDDCLSVLTILTSSSETKEENREREESEHPEVDRIGRACRADVRCDSGNAALPNDESAARLLEVRTAQRDALANNLAEVLQAFRRELAGSYTTAEQQQTLRDARALLAECGR